MVLEFHVSRSCREKYSLSRAVYSISGDLLIADFHQARILAQKINEQRIKENLADQTITAGQINALGVIHEIYHYIIRVYEESINPGVFSNGFEKLTQNIGAKEIDEVITGFTNLFPPLDVYKKVISSKNYIEGKTKSKPNKEILWEEIILLNLENSNPAFEKLKELFNDDPIAESTHYNSLITETDNFFKTQKSFGKENLSLISFLKKPILSSPTDIEGQLEFIMKEWKELLPDSLLQKILKSTDLIKEDIKLFLQHGGGEKATPPVPVYKKLEPWEIELLKAKLAAGEQLTDEEKYFYEHEPEKFTADLDWMPNVVMIAKNIFVWLSQLSQKYGREINRLDQIPNEELDTLARWNIAALWLIGVWERSPASKKIKQFMGNPEAASSAYSLFDYSIAHELGGEDAFQNLRTRASERGIRLASDMVPNHTGIFSKWIISNPDFFLSSERPPFPGYSFSGPDLSDDPNVQIRIEDKYYTRSDAAVVFQRIDNRSGKVIYIYHGNDGTNMPWNDTAQLNLLKPEVREALIETIKHVAGRFHIIRFDAAMTLTKKHYQRLWFPQPGTGGAIPSRSDYAMSKYNFDKAMPKEFWREVVDRINFEMPNTLLLAEAFWLMEGYFVRSLGMHRVYNSAFMHMTMKEENDKFRLLIKNTLEFNPEILKRYVNFMSNPDEETAINQFGKEDKYFGVAVLMATLPGLPMFGHGQIEGFSEKYGMEYKRAYYNEQPDLYLMARHEIEIFPLLKKRYLFSQALNFELYDFYDFDGQVNENVFAYSNRAGNERALVVYNNAYQSCKGRITFSALKISSGEERNNLASKNLTDALDLKPYENFYYVCRDHKTNLEYLLSGKELHDHGINFELQGYEYAVYLDFKEIYDTTGDYERLANHLGRRGVISIKQELLELSLKPVHKSINELLNPEAVNKFFEAVFYNGKEKLGSFKIEKFFANDSFEFFRGKIEKIVSEINELLGLKIEKDSVHSYFINEFLVCRYFVLLLRSGNSYKARWVTEAYNTMRFSDVTFRINVELFYLCMFHKTILFIDRRYSKGQSINLFSKLMLDKVLRETFCNFGHDDNYAASRINLLKAITSVSVQNILNEEFFNKKDDAPEDEIVLEIFRSLHALNFIGYNEYMGTKFFNKEKFEELLDWLFTLSGMEKARNILLSLSALKEEKGVKEKTKKFSEKKFTSVQQKKEFFSHLKPAFEIILDIKEAALKSEYKSEELFQLLKSGKR